jgi:ribose 1,5-bisphosphokinase
MAAPEAQPGVFVALVGPSGAGKDSLLAGAREHFRGGDGVVFVRRVITREPDIYEDHEPATPLQFRLMQEQGAFALAWQANGLSYGLPIALAEALRQGAVVVANVSRHAVPGVRAAFPRCLVVHVTASVDVLAARLAARGRESDADQGARLARSLLLEQAVDADIRIENNGSLAAAQQRFIEVLRLFDRSSQSVEASP